MPTAPILFLIFNRPDLTKQSFARIRQARPSQLFVAADGPRPDRPEDIERCTETRAIVERVDWPCEVKTLFREKNLGCRQAVSQAITWFFEQVEEGIILEDDCVPDLSFFRFCAELLKRYGHEPRIMSINGTNWQNGRMRGSASYYFSRYPTTWGWATWANRWRGWGNDDEKIDDIVKRKLLRRSGYGIQESRRIIDNIKDSLSVDTWDYSWYAHVLYREGLCVVPNVNLVENSGFDGSATHTKTLSDNLRTSANRIVFPLSHPQSIIRHDAADRYTSMRRRGYPHPYVQWINFWKLRLTVMLKRAIRKS